MKLLQAGNIDLPDGFLELSAVVYDGDPRWVPEQPDSVERAFSEANPWFESGESAAFCIPGKARIAVFRNDQMVVEGEPAAYFGYWETTGDEQADALLFEAAEAWAKDRGAKRLCGPIDFSTYGNYRLRLHCEENGLTFANEPYNPTYYPSILDGRGFKRAAEAVTQLADASLSAAVRQARMPRLEAVREAGFRIEAFPHEVWVERIEELYEIVDAMFGQNWGYTPISLDVFKQVCGHSFIRKTCPNTSTIAYASDGRIAGFFLAYPHWGPLIQQDAQNRVPLGELDYHKHWDALVDTGTVMVVPKTSATLPEFQGQGVFTALTISMFERGEGVFSHYFGALIGADKLNRRYGDGLADDSRWYAVYAKRLV